MLLYPFEKQFNLVPARVESGNGESREGKVAGKKNQSAIGVRIILIFNFRKWVDQWAKERGRTKTVVEWEYYRKSVE